MLLSHTEVLGAEGKQRLLLFLCWDCLTPDNERETLIYC